MTDPAQPVEATPTPTLVERLRELASCHWEYGHERILEEAATALSLAQTENAGHIRIEDELKSDLAQAQARCAELERAVLGECEECGHTIISPLHHLSSVEKDAARYRWLRENSTRPGEPWSTHQNPESLDAAIDAAISAGKP